MMVCEVGLGWAPGLDWPGPPLGEDPHAATIIAIASRVRKRARITPIE